MDNFFSLACGLWARTCVDCVDGLRKIMTALVMLFCLIVVFWVFAQVLTCVYLPPCVVSHIDVDKRNYAAMLSAVSSTFFLKSFGRVAQATLINLVKVFSLRAHPHEGEALGGGGGEEERTSVTCDGQERDRRDKSVPVCRFDFHCYVFAVLM